MLRTTRPLSATIASAIPVGSVASVAFALAFLKSDSFNSLSPSESQASNCASASGSKTSRWLHAFWLSVAGLPSAPDGDSAPDGPLDGLAGRRRHAGCAARAHS
eukprot:980450-Pleurochrysis_carterae.AAC.2